MEYLGQYKAVYKAKAGCEDILSKAQDGGIVTAMFAYALETGIIDGAIVAGPGEEAYKPEPMIATTVDELLAARGTKYSISPNMSLIKEATRSYSVSVTFRTRLLLLLVSSVWRTSHTRVSTRWLRTTVQPRSTMSPRWTLERASSLCTPSAV